MHFLSKHCCCHALMSKSCVLPWSQCSSLVSTAHGRTRLLVWKPVFLCVPIGFTYNTDHITFHVEHTMSTQSSYALLLDYRSIAQPFIKNPAPTMYISGSQLQQLTPRSFIFKSTRGIPNTNQPLPDLRNQHLGFWEWRTTNIHTHTTRCLTVLSTF